MAIVTVHWFPLQHAVLVTHPCLRSAIFVFVLVFDHCICICTCTWSLYLYLYLYLVTRPCLLQMLLFNRICTWEDIHAPRKNTLEINFVFLFFFRDLKRYAGEDSGSGKSGNSSGNMSKKVNSDLTCFTVLQISSKKQSSLFFAKVNFQFLLL